jgi:predicted component of type VI protein secretion system
MTAADSPLARPGSGGLAVRLVRRERAGAADGEPFVVLRETAGARVLLGELVGEHGEVAARFRWKLRRDDESGRLAGGPAPLTNGAADAAWARERAEPQRVRGEHVERAVGVPAGMLASAPLLWCRRVDRFFHPVAPATGARLRVCRDDALLARSGLPSYAQDVVRYLHDGGTAAPATFYRQARDAAGVTLASGAQVRGASRLVRDWAALVHAGPGDRAAAAAAGDLPCVTCEHRFECYPAAAGEGPLPAERELHALSFHDVDAVALEAADFDWDEACALLGGAALADVLAARGDPARAAVLPPATTTALTTGPQWLFAADARRFPLEVLRQKLALFRGACDGVAAVHATGRPHLALEPRNVAVHWRGGSGAPARWQLSARVGALGSAKPAAAADAEPGSALALGALLEPGDDMRDDPRARAWLAPAALGGDGAAATLAVACWQTGSPDGLVRFSVEGSGDGVPRGVLAGDLAVVQPLRGGPCLVVRVDDVRPRGLLATALLPADDPCLQWDGQQFDARLRFHRRLGPAADLHGLGLLLLRALCADDGQRVDDVAAALANVLRRCGDESAGARADGRAAVARLQQQLEAPDVRARFDPLHLLHCQRDRDALRTRLQPDAPAVEPQLWMRALAIAARALGTAPPFAYASSPADGGDGVRALTADVDALLRRLDVELFHADTCAAAVAAAAAEVAERERASGANAGATTSAPERGFQLEVHRDGDPEVQELRYRIDRVTIGRREGQNLLRLNDPMVSSLHAVIHGTPEGWAVSDRNSTNGTEVDGIRLPVDVPQPLHDGSAIVIRPFRLVFRELAANAPARGPSVAELHDRLRDAFAASLGAPDVAVHEAMLVALQGAREELPGADWLAALDALAAGGAGGGDAGGGDSSDAAAAQRALQATAARALGQLARTLLGEPEPGTPEQVQQFAGKLGRFVEATSEWIQRTLELRKVLGDHLDLGMSTASGKAPLRTAAEVRTLALGFTSGDAAAQSSAWYVAKFYEDLTGVMVGLLRGNQQVRRALRERLDPARLVELACRDAKARGAVQAAASSPLWRVFAEAFAELTGGGESDGELERVLRRVAPERDQQA